MHPLRKPSLSCLSHELRACRTYHLAGEILLAHPPSSENSPAGQSADERCRNPARPPKPQDCHLLCKPLTGMLNPAARHDLVSTVAVILSSTRIVGDAVPYGKGSKRGAALRRPPGRCRPHHALLATRNEYSLRTATKFVISVSVRKLDLLFSILRDCNDRRARSDHWPGSLDGRDYAALSAWSPYRRVVLCLFQSAWPTARSREPGRSMRALVEFAFDAHSFVKRLGTLRDSLACPPVDGRAKSDSAR